jgi:hypothetical protein
MQSVVNRESREGLCVRDWKDVLIVHYASTRQNELRKWMSKRDFMRVRVERMSRCVTDHKIQTSVTRKTEKH